MMPAGREDRRAIIAGAVVILLAVGYLRGVKPALAGLAERHATLAEQRALLARERALLADSAHYPEAQRAVSRALAAESSRLFAGDSVAAIAELTSFTAGVATSNGIHLTTMEGRPAKNEHGVMQLSVDIRGEGTWRQVLLFVRALESSSHLVNVPSVRIERGPRGGPLGGAMVSVAATVTGFTQGIQ